MENPGVRARVVTVVASGALVVTALAGCTGEVSPQDRAQARVTAAERALSTAEADFAAASDEFCRSSQEYIHALDRYGDVLQQSAVTVGDVRAAGADLSEPRDSALAGADAAVAAKQDVETAREDLAAAEAALAATQTGAAEAPAESAAASELPSVPAASVDRVKQADADFAAAQASVSDETPLVEASEQFNSAVVALEWAWIRLFADAGCLTPEQEQQAQSAVSAYTVALQQGLTDAGFYTGVVDGVYGPETVAAVQALQESAGLPVTGTVDKATSEALEQALAEIGGAAAQETVASTAALQQTLKLLGRWDGPVDGVWTPELTTALQELQVDLGVEPTGTVDAATVSAFEKALNEATAEETPEPTPEPTD